MWLDGEGPSSPPTLLKHMTELFSQFGSIAPRYSLKQINAGIWALLESFNYRQYVWDGSVPLVDRTKCIRAMYNVYADFVAKSEVEVMENCFDIWWDSIASGFWNEMSFARGIREGDVASLDNESRALLDSMFDTLSAILALPDKRTQQYALHGLGHLHHPGVHDLVQEFINANPGAFSSDGLKWVEQCRDGTVM
jgi:hypothetical protein